MSGTFSPKLGGALVKRCRFSCTYYLYRTQSETGEAVIYDVSEPSLKVSGIGNIKNGVQINTPRKSGAFNLNLKLGGEQQLQKKIRRNATETERAEVKRKYYEKLGFNEEAIALLGQHTRMCQ